MSHILSPENILISLLSGYNTYFCTENRAQLPTSDRPALVLQHLRRYPSRAAYWPFSSIQTTF